MLDVNSSGFISAESVQKVLGDDFARTDFQAIFEGQSKISLQDFTCAWNAFWQQVFAEDVEHSDMSGVNVVLTSSGETSLSSSLGKDGALESEMDADEEETSDMNVVSEISGCEVVL